MRKITFALFIFALVGAIYGQTQNQSQKPSDSSEKAEKRKELEQRIVSVKKLASESKYEQALPVARRKLKR